MNKHFKWFGLIIILLTTLMACSTPIEEYKNHEPDFDIRTFFDGELKGWGLVKDYRNKVNRRFVVDMRASWEKNTGTLYEIFRYADGSTQERTWTLIKGDNGAVQGTASDVTGSAQGKSAGFSFYWDYDLNIQVDGENMNVHLQDWIYQINQEAVINQAQIKKYGLPVGEVIVFIMKQPTHS